MQHQQCKFWYFSYVDNVSTDLKLAIASAMPALNQLKSRSKSNVDLTTLSRLCQMKKTVRHKLTMISLYNISSLYITILQLKILHLTGSAQCVCIRGRGGGGVVLRSAQYWEQCLPLLPSSCFCKWSTMLVTAAPAGGQAMMAVIIRYFIVTGDTLSAQLDTLPLRGSHQSLLWTCSRKHNRSFYGVLILFCDKYLLCCSSFYSHYFFYSPVYLCIPFSYYLKLQYHF